MSAPPEEAAWTDAMYFELRRIAANHMRNESNCLTLRPTELVHEAYVRLHGNSHGACDRDRFLALVSKVMRRVLVDHARRRGSFKRGGDYLAVAMADAETEVSFSPAKILDVDELISGLSTENPALVEIAELTFFSGCTVAEISRITGFSERSVARKRAQMIEILRKKVG